MKISEESLLPPVTSSSEAMYPAKLRSSTKSFFFSSGSEKKDLERARQSLKSVFWREVMRIWIMLCLRNASRMLCAKRVFFGVRVIFGGMTKVGSLKTAEEEWVGGSFVDAGE